MKERLGKSIQEQEDEEAKKRAEEDEDSKKLPPTARAKQLRREAHKEAVKLWDSAREAEAEMLTDTKMLKGNAGPVLARLRTFVESFSNSKCRMLPHGNKEKAKEAFWQFKVDGLELIAIAALLDPSATASLIASHINYKIVSRSGSKEVARDCQALLEAIADVQQRVDNFLVVMGRERAAALDAEDERQAEEERAGGALQPGEEVVIVGAPEDRQEAQEVEVSQDVNEEVGSRGVVLSANQTGAVVRLASGRRLTVPRFRLKRAPPEPRDADVVSKDTGKDTGNDIAKAPDGQPKPFIPAARDQQAKSEAEPKASPQQDGGPKLLAKQQDFSPALADPERLQWDPNFHHPYVGAMDGAGGGIFCRACCRWIPTRKYAHEPFLRHVKVAHKKPPQGWKGPVPEEADGTKA